MTNKARMYKKRSQESFDRQAARNDVSDDGAHARSLYPHFIQELSRLSYHSLLDVGCGTGELLSQVAQRDELDLAGIDLSPNMIDVARRKLGGRADLQVGEAEDLPWLEDSFDVAVCMDSFHHFPRPRRELAEIRRVLNPGGWFILGDLWAPIPIRQIMNLLMPFSKRGDVHVYSLKEIRKLLEESGFTPVHCRVVTQSAYMVTAVVRPSQ